MVASNKLNFFRGSWIADYADPENYFALFYSKNLTLMVLIILTLMTLNLIVYIT